MHHLLIFTIKHHKLKMIKNLLLFLRVQIFLSTLSFMIYQLPNSFIVIDISQKVGKNLQIRLLAAELTCNILLLKFMMRVLIANTDSPTSNNLKRSLSAELESWQISITQLLDEIGTCRRALNLRKFISLNERKQPLKWYFI